MSSWEPPPDTEYSLAWIAESLSRIAQAAETLAKTDGEDE